MIKLEDVTKVYKGEVLALRDASCDIQRGEFVFLVGQSGSGKSTLASAIMQSLPYEGEMILDGEVVNKNEYSLFVKIEDTDIDSFLHCNDLTYLNNGEEELAKYKKGDKIKVKVLEIKSSEQKVRVGLKQTLPDPFDFFKDKEDTLVKYKTHEGFERVMIIKK